MSRPQSDVGGDGGPHAAATLVGSITAAARYGRAVDHARDAPGVRIVAPMPSQPLPFDPVAEARRHWIDRWAVGEHMAAATSLMRAQQLVLAAVEDELRPFGLTFASYEALMLLSFTRRGEMPLGKMSERLMVHPASITNTVDRLEEKGFVAAAARRGRQAADPGRHHRGRAAGGGRGDRAAEQDPVRARRCSTSPRRRRSTACCGRSRAGDMADGRRRPVD